MRTVGFSVSVPANGQVANALGNSTLNTVGRPSYLSLFMNAAAVGVSASASWASGGESGVLQDAGTPVNVAAVVGNVDETRDVMFEKHPIPGGSQMVLTLVNSTGAAIIVTGRVKVGP